MVCGKFWHFGQVLKLSHNAKSSLQKLILSAFFVNFLSGFGYVDVIYLYMQLYLYFHGDFELLLGSVLSLSVPVLAARRRSGCRSTGRAVCVDTAGESAVGRSPSDCTIVATSRTGER